MRTTASRLCAAMLAAALTAFGADETAKFAAPSKSAAADGPRAAERDHFDELYRFIFFATLEGLYRDGLSSADVEALLAKKRPNGGYVNFIYTCPICMPVEGAVRTYAVRPKIDNLKIPNRQATERTFGPGLPKETSEALRSEKASVRLGAVNELVSKWISYRMDHSGLSDDQRKELVEKLKQGREDGMRALNNFAQDRNGPGSLNNFAPGYAGGDECAICNAAVQMPLKLKPPASR